MLMLARNLQIIDYIWQDNTKQAEMPYFHCGPSKQENILIRLDQNEEKINIKK